MSETSVKLFLASCMGNSSGDETGHSLSGEHSRALLRFRLTFAAMLRTPQIVVICLVLLLGISSRVHAQASPSPIYYLIEHVDVRSHDSLRGFEIGTQVELVQDFGDRLRVKSGNFEFEVDRKLLTNDSGIASQVWENYQAALENYLVQQEQLADQAAAALAEQQQHQAEEKQQQQEAAQQQAQQQPQVDTVGSASSTSSASDTNRAGTERSVGAASRTATRSRDSSGSSAVSAASVATQLRRGA